MAYAWFSFDDETERWKRLEGDCFQKFISQYWFSSVNATEPFEERHTNPFSPRDDSFRKIGNEPLIQFPTSLPSAICANVRAWFDGSWPEQLDVIPNELLKFIGFFPNIGSAIYTATGSGFVVALAIGLPAGVSAKKHSQSPTAASTTQEPAWN